MLINGLWFLCSDDLLRPVMRGQIQGTDGFWHEFPFLVDTGGDRTVFSANVLEALDISPEASSLRVVGVGGASNAMTVETKVRFALEGEGWATFQGRWTAVLSEDALDMSVLGRDLLNQFALIVDRPRDVMCLLGQRHSYKIEQQ